MDSFILEKQVATSREYDWIVTALKGMVSASNDDIVHVKLYGKAVIRAKCGIWGRTYRSMSEILWKRLIIHEKIL